MGEEIHPHAQAEYVVFPPVGRYNRTIYRETQGYRIEIADIGSVRVDRQGNLQETYRHPTAHPSLLEDAITGHVMPLVWSLRGGFVLHGSAVATPAGAVLFLGPSGLGKSTLAAAFESIEGCRVLDDDAALVEKRGDRIVVHETPRGVSLWQDSLDALGARFPNQRMLSAYGTKYRIRREAEEADWPEIGSDRVFPLAAAFYVSPPTGEEPPYPRFTSMTASDKHIRLARSATRIDLTDTELLRDQFAFIADFMRIVPIRQLHYRRDYDALPQTCRAILEETAALIGSRDESEADATPAARADRPERS